LAQTARTLGRTCSTAASTSIEAVQFLAEYWRDDLTSRTKQSSGTFRAGEPQLFAHETDYGVS